MSSYLVKLGTGYSWDLKNTPIHIFPQHETLLIKTNKSLTRCFEKWTFLRRVLVSRDDWWPSPILAVLLSSFGVISPKDMLLNYFCFPIFWYLAYLMKVIPETCRVHYLRFYCDIIDGTIISICVISNSNDSIQNINMAFTIIKT